MSYLFYFKNENVFISFAQEETDLLLPALENGIGSPDWRIRYFRSIWSLVTMCFLIRLAAVQLLGTLLLKLAGVTGKMFVGDVSIGGVTIFFLFKTVNFL